MITTFRLFVIVCTIFPISLFAQLTGKLVDEKNNAVPFANISLLNAGDSALKASGLTDSIGKFSIPSPVAGDYILRFTAIGFQVVKTEPFTITDPTSAREIGSIAIKREDKTLSNVTITALRPTITQLADRMVVSVEGTAMAAGSNAYSVLAKAPGVFIDHEGNIQLNGRSGVTVMIDGRPSYLSARDLRNLLEGMPAENLKNLELITNPSAKYEAEGTSGIININLKKNIRQGMNGSVYTSYNYNFKQHGFTTGGNINYKNGKWNTSLNLDMARRVGGREATFTRIFYAPTKTTYFDQVATGNFVVQGPPAIRTGIDYSITDKHSVGVMLNYTTNKAEQDFLTDTYIGSSPKDPDQYIDANNYNENTYKNFTGNFHYNGKLDTIGSTLTTDIDYVRIRNVGSGNFYNYFHDLNSGDETQDFLYTSTPNGYNISSARVDYTKMFRNKSKIEIGGRASQVLSDNNSQFYFNNGSLELDPLRTNHFNYREKIFAGYVNWSGNLSKKVTLQTGLRGEKTISKGKSFTTGQVNEREYFDLFPSVFLQHKISDNYGINYSYSRRLTRPNYGNLNPFRAYRDPYTWVQGNPYLRPQYTHSFSIAQVIKKVYNVTLSYQMNKDVMAEVPILDVANATTVYTTGNIDDGYNVGMTAVAPVKLAKKWDSQNTLVLSYAKFSVMSNNGPLVNDQLFVMVQSNHTIQLPKDYRMEVNMLFRGPAASGLYLMHSMHRVDVAFKKSFFKKKFDLTLNANDLFAGWRFYWTTDINGNVNDFDQYFRFRSLGFSLRYNFSKGLKVEQKKSNSIEEVNRL